jgi:membrane protein DedA with SNARE-associated domain
MQVDGLDSCPFRLEGTSFGYVSYENPLDMLLAKAGAGLASTGSSGLLGLLFLTEMGLPIPIPADLLMIFLGERVSAGALPLVGVIVALEVIAVAGTIALFLVARGPGRGLMTRIGPRVGLTEARLNRVRDAIDRRGTPALAAARSTPGLRTATVLAAAGSGLRPPRALIALIIGSTIFLQGHFLLGLALGPAARRLFEGSAILLIAVLVVLVAAAFFLHRRRNKGGLSAISEAACPACFALGLITEREPQQ